jgi:hypothetical protein
MTIETITKEVSLMIYANLPLHYRYFPVDVNDEGFQMLFMCNFEFYLDKVANTYMEILEEKNEGLHEGHLIWVADIAKKAYTMKNNIEEPMEEFRDKCCECHYKRKLLFSNLQNLEYNFADLTRENILYGVNLFHIIYDKI